MAVLFQFTGTSRQASWYSAIAASVRSATSAVAVPTIVRAMQRSAGDCLRACETPVMQ
jgi:hypothetical protein